MNKKIKAYWLIPTVILSGAFGFLTSSFSFFTFTKEISIMEIVNIAVTLIVGVFISNSIQKNIEVKKFEKELTYEIINSLLQKVKTINNYLSINSLKFKETVKGFKDISNLITELDEINKICLTIDTSDIEILRNSYMIIKPLITGSPTSGNNLNLSSEHKKLSEIELKKIKINLIKIKVNTNRK